MKQETKSLLNVIGNLTFSIIIPIYILNSTKLPFSPEIRLIIAILFPLFFGAYEWWLTKKHNLLSLFGLINVVITGGFGLMQLSGSWFSLKEAIFPFLIGLFVFISGIQNKPLFRKLMTSPELFDSDKLQAKLSEKNKSTEFDQLVARSNHIFALSFFLSALLNFVIAEQTFLPISETLDATQKANTLNEQIALMHKRGFLGIAIPSMLMMMGLLTYYFKQVERLTGESIDSFFHQTSTTAKK